MQSRSRLIGMAAALGITVLEIVYVIVLGFGLAALQAPTDPIPDPYFTGMEVLILLMMPVIVVMMAAIHVSAGEDQRIFSLLALVFAAILTGMTSAVHFLVLVLSREAEFAGWDRSLTFNWPSVVYVIDIYAWDLAFALSALSAAMVFEGPGLGRWIRGVLLVSGVLAMVGLAGVPGGDMQIRNIGIIGYAVVFPVATYLIFLHFRRAKAD